MREPHRTVRTVVVVYDCSRLLFLLFLLTAFTGSGPAGMFRGAGGNLPFMMYAAPHALFPLMSFFLLFRLEPSKAYIPLYITGKAFCILCLILWLTFSPAGEIPYPMLWPVFIGAADLGTILGMVVLQSTFSRGEVGVQQNDAQDDGAGTRVLAETPDGGE
jgi:hypothetical protein